MNTWTETRDELPPLNKKVWVCEGGNVRETMYGSNWAKRSEYIAHLQRCGITHWMLFLPPEPPTIK